MQQQQELQSVTRLCQVKKTDVSRFTSAELQHECEQIAAVLV
jgi:hypothetical protein